MAATEQGGARTSVLLDLVAPPGAGGSDRRVPVLGAGAVCAARALSSSTQATLPSPPPPPVGSREPGGCASEAVTMQAPWGLARSAPSGRRAWHLAPARNECPAPGSLSRGPSPGLCRGRGAHPGGPGSLPRLPSCDSQSPRTLRPTRYRAEGRGQRAQSGGQGAPTRRGHWRVRGSWPSTWCRPTSNVPTWGGAQPCSTAGGRPSSNRGSRTEAGYLGARGGGPHRAPFPGLAQTLRGRGDPRGSGHGPAWRLPTGLQVVTPGPLGSRATARSPCWLPQGGGLRGSGLCWRLGGGHLGWPS